MTFKYINVSPDLLCSCIKTLRPKDQQKIDKITKNKVAPSVPGKVAICSGNKIPEITKKTKMI